MGASLGMQGLIYLVDFTVKLDSFQRLVKDHEMQSRIVSGLNGFL